MSPEGIRGVRAREPALGSDRVSEAALDHTPMEELGRIDRAETKRELRVRQGLAAAAAPRERPCEDVVTVDRRALALRQPRERHRALRCDLVVHIEEGDLEVDVDA